MFRFLSAIFLGYLVLAALVVGAFAPLMLRPQLAFAPDSLEPKIEFLAVMLAISVLAAVAGGYVASWRGGRRAAQILAALVLVFGLIEAGRNAQRPRPEVPKEKIAQMSMRVRAENCVQPLGYSLALPFFGAGGVLVGGWLRGRKRPTVV